MGIDFERLSDEELIEKGRVGEEGAINQLLRRYWQRICGYAVTMLGSVEDAEDAAQETLLRVFRWRGSFREGERFGPWIYKIATNVCFDRIRSRRREVVGLEVDGLESLEETPVDLYERKVVRGKVRQALFSLPETYRQVVYLRYGAEMSYREIASALEISLAAVETRLFRAKEQMRRLLRRSLECER